MKKYISLLIIGLLFCANVHAQQDESPNELFDVMEQLQKELFQNLQSIEADSLGYQLYFDTLMVQDFGDFFGPLDGNSGNPSIDSEAFEQLFKQMEEQLSQMNEEDWNQMGQLFENFGLMPFGSIQQVDPQEDNGSENLPKKKDGTKRKIYKM